MAYSPRGHKESDTTEQLTLSHFGPWRDLASRLDCACGSMSRRAEVRAGLR